MVSQCHVADGESINEGTGDIEEGGGKDWSAAINLEQRTGQVLPPQDTSSRALKQNSNLIHLLSLDSIPVMPAISLGLQAQSALRHGLLSYYNFVKTCYRSADSPIYQYVTGEMCDQETFLPMTAVIQ